jgi:cation:H+ antiporter
LGLLFLSDIFYTDGLLFNSLSKSTFFLAAIGILVTSAYIWGLLERRNQTLLRMGIDSIVVIMIQLFGIIVLYFMD